MINVIERNGGMELGVRVIPRASKSEVGGEQNGALKVRLTSPPVDGEANAELIRLLAKAFGVPKTNVEIIAGHASRQKRVRVRGASDSVVRKVLGR